MRKLLGAALVWALVVVSGSARAEGLLKNLKLSGSIDVQGTSANNVTDFNSKTYDQIGDVQTRVMINGDWDILDDVHAKVTLGKNNRIWGNGSATTFAGTPGGLGQSGESLTTVQGAIYVDQAYFKVDKVFGAVDLTMGRQFYGDPGDMVVYFGPYNGIYGMPVSSVDAARWDWANSMLGVTGVVGKVTSTAWAPGTATESGAVDIRGLVANMLGMSNANLGAYWWNRASHLSTNGAAPVGNDFLNILGIKGKYTMGGLYAGGEVAKNFGQNRIAGTRNDTYTGSALKIDLGYKGDVGVASINPWLNFAWGSGDKPTIDTNRSNNNFTAINADFRAGDIYSRFASPWAATTMGAGTTAGNLSLSNRSIWGIGLKGTPSSMSKLSAGIAYWDYRYAGSRNAPTAAKGNAHIGSEFDIDLGWKHSENVTLNTGIGQWWNGGGIANTVATNSPISLYYFDAHVKF